MGAPGKLELDTYPGYIQVVVNVDPAYLLPRAPRAPLPLCCSGGGGGDLGPTPHPLEVHGGRHRRERALIRHHVDTEAGPRDAAAALDGRPGTRAPAGRSAPGFKIGARPVGSAGS